MVLDDYPNGTRRLQLDQHLDTWCDLEQASIVMHLEAQTKWTHRCIWTLQSSRFGDALGGYNWGSIQMHLESEIIWTQRWTSRFLVCQPQDAHRANHRTKFMIGQDALSMKTMKYISRLQLSELRDSHAGHQGVRYKMLGVFPRLWH